MEYARFGPAGNSEAFYAAGKKHTYEAPEWLKEEGLDAYEYQAGNGITASVPTFEKIGLEAKKHGIALSLHAPYFISLSGVEEKMRQNSIGYILKSEAAARALGANIIVIHTGSAAKITREEAMRLAADTMEKTLEALGDTPVKLGLETMGKINQLGTLDEVITLCRADSRLAPVVDFGHLNARDLGEAFKDKGDYMRVFEKIGIALGDDTAKNLHCHFSRIEYTKMGEKKHLKFTDEAPFGPDFVPLMEAIAELKLTPTIICESAGTMSEDALMMKKEYMKRTEK